MEFLCPWQMITLSLALRLVVSLYCFLREKISPEKTQLSGKHLCHLSKHNITTIKRIDIRFPHSLVNNVCIHTRKYEVEIHCNSGSGYTILANKHTYTYLYAHVYTDTQRYAYNKRKLKSQ